LGRRIDASTTTELDLAKMEVDSVGSLAMFKILEKVDLSENWIRFPRQIEKMFDAPSLRELDLRNNDICKTNDYRAFIIHSCPTLEILDGIEIVEYERIEAEKLFENRKEIPYAEMELQPGSMRPTWVNDQDVTACFNCRQSFTIVNRRHHCRACGQIFCSKCCRRWLLLPEGFGYPDPERTCTDCFKKHSRLDFSRGYDVSGPEDAPAIVILHPSLASRMYHVYQMKHWSQKYRVYLIDFPAHGGRMDEKLTMSAAIQSVTIFIQEKVPAKKALIFGWSLGGYVAMMMGKYAPELCAGIICGGCARETWSGQTKLFFGIKKVIYSSLPEKILWTLIPKNYPHIPRDIIDEAILSVGMNYGVWGQCAETLLEPQQGTYAEAISQYKGPVLFINGELESRKSEALFLSKSSSGKLHIIKGGTHLTPLEPEHCPELNEVVMNFAKEIGW